MVNAEYNEEKVKALIIRQKAVDKLAAIEKDECIFLARLERVYRISHDTQRYNALLNEAQSVYSELKNQAQEVIDGVDEWLRKFAEAEELETAALEAGFDLSSIPGYESYYASQNQ